MVDEIVIDQDAGEVVAGQEDLEACNEYVFESIRAYLRNNGYECFAIFFNRQLLHTSIGYRLPLEFEEWTVA